MIEPGLLAVAARSPVVLDAAMATRLVDHGLDVRRDEPALWNLSRPDAVAAVHALDVEAGADALLTNTFGANRCRLARSGHAADTVAVNRRAAEIAREAAGPSRFVIGSIGPTASAVPGAYREQAEALVAAGVDALVFETHRIDQARVALKSVRPAVSLPLIVSLFQFRDPVELAVRMLEDLGASAIGSNCQVGPAPYLEMLGTLRGLTRLPLWVKPSGGLPGEPYQSPDSFGAAVPELVRLGVRFIGGCCGTTEAHVAALRAGCYAIRE